MTAKSLTETLTEWSKVCKCRKHTFIWAGGFLFCMCRVINFVTFYFGQGFVEKINCICESNVASPKSTKRMCYSTFHRCMCIIYKWQPWLDFDCIYWETQTLADFFRRIQLHKDLKNRFGKFLCQKDIVSFFFFFENQPPRHVFYSTLPLHYTTSFII